MNAWHEDAIYALVNDRRLEDRIEDAWLAECAPHIWRRNWPLRGLR